MTVSARPSREELLAYAVGKLSDADSERVAAYVESDPDCQAMLATLDGTDDTLVGQLRLPEADDPFAAESQCDAALARAKGMTEPDAASAESLALGTLGEYRLLEKLGQGGMGTVYKALHTKLDRVVALKVIAKERMNDPQAVARFGREMKAIGQLDHPGIVAAFDAREIDGVPVLIMEYVDGMDLGRLVRRHGPVAVADACELVRRTALALHYAHEHGLVHRDVKPSNVMLTRSGDVKLLDLGLARGPETPSCGAGVSPAESPAGGTPAPQSHVGRSVLTNTGQAMGTADYMAPEQVAAPQTVDIRADIYSLGCTLFKLLSGQAPYDGTDCGGTLEKLAAHTDRPVPRIAEAADVHEALAATVDRMLAKSPDDRPETPAAVAAAIAPFCKGHNLSELLRRAEAQTSPHAEHATAQPLPAGRRWKLITTVIALMLFSFALGTACGVLITIRRGDQQTAVQVPDGANVDIDEDGNVNVTLPPGAAGDASHDEKAIQGTWAVVIESLGGAGRYFFMPDALPHQTPTGQKNDNPADATGEATRFVFSDGTFKLRGNRVWMTSGTYQVHQDSEQKLINMKTPDGSNLLCVYKLEGDRLTLRVASSKGPTEFWPEFGSHRGLLVLRRVGDPETHSDEKAILGKWHVAKVATGKLHCWVCESPRGGSTAVKIPSLSEWLSKPLAVTFQSDAIWFSSSRSWSPESDNMANPSDYWAATCTIDPTYRPATVDANASEFLIVIPGSQGTEDRCFLRGIYRLDGETLRLRFKVCTGNPQSGHRPSDFDGKLGDNEFELVLSRKKPVELVPSRKESQAADHLDFRLAPTRETMPRPPAFDLQKRPEAGLAWFETRDGVGQNLVTAEHEGRRYVLLSTKPDEVLLGGRYGPPDWKLSSVGLARDERGKPMLQLELDEAGGKRLAKLTGEHLGRQMAVLVDDRVVTVPTIRSAIATKVAITGNFDMPEVEAIQKALAAGIETPAKKDPGEKRGGTADERR